MWKWALFLLPGLALSGQALSSLSGSVTDPSGALIPGASISLVNAATGAKRAATSDSAGNYTFPQLSPATYTLSAAAAGFRSLSLTGVTVQVQSPATRNIELELSATADSVTVSAESNPVNTQDSSLGNNFSSKPILQLPFEGRNIIGLLALQPGVTYYGENNPSSYRSGNVNGGKSDQANITLDGVDANDQDSRASFTTAFRISLDTVQEFRVVTTGANADLGRASGAQISLVSKGGTNDVHGSAYEFLRNKATNANSFFNNQAGVPLAKLNRNIYGATLGGPVRKNRLFLFGNYEGRHDSREDSTVQRVPAQSLRDGQLKYLRTDRTTATLTPDDVKTRVDPLGTGANAAALAVLRSYPLPNDSSTGDGLNTSGFRFNAPVRLHWQSYMTKFDAILDKASKHTLFVRGNLQDDNENEIPQFPGQPPNNTSLDNSRGLAVGWNAVLTNSLVNTFRYGITRTSFEDTGLSKESFVYFRNLEPATGDTRAYIRKTPTHTFANDVTWTHARHDFKFGGVLRFIRNSRNDYSNSFHEATANPTWLSDAGASLNTRLTDMARGSQTQFREAAMDLIGIVSQGTAHYNYTKTGQALALGAPIARRFDAEEYELYAQDTWKATKTITLTYGLRWSLMPPVHEASGTQTSTRIPLSDFFAQRAAYADNGIPQSRVAPVEYLLKEQPGGRDLYPFHKKNFAPRFAAAWAPGKTVVRAGWGMYYDLIGAGLISNYDSVSLGLQSNISNPSGSLTAATAPRYTGLHSIPAGLLPAAPASGFPLVAPNLFDINSAIDDKVKPPYTMNMNFTVSQDFGRGWFVQGSYVGRLSRRSLLYEDMAQPTNLRDSISGVTYFEAAQQLARLALANTPAAGVQKIPYWENMFPAAANATLSATQRVYQRYLNNSPDFVTALYQLDTTCTPACSKFGKYAYFNSQYAFLGALRSVGKGNYNGMQFSVRKTFANGDQLDFNYTLSKSIDLGSRPESSQSSDGTIINSWNRAQFRGVSDYDARHQFNANWIYGLPWMKKSRFLGGWQLGGLYRQSSGLPISSSNGRNFPTNWNIAGYATPTGLPFQDGTNKNAPAPTGGTSGPNIFQNPVAAFAAFTSSLPGLPGPRNGIRGDGNFNIDMNLGKTFQMPWRESHSMQFRWEVFNVTNTARFDPKSIDLTIGAQSTFGKYTDTFTLPRVMQFTLRYAF